MAEKILFSGMPGIEKSWAFWSAIYGSQHGSIKDRHRLAPGAVSRAARTGRSDKSESLLFRSNFFDVNFCQLRVA